MCSVFIELIELSIIFYENDGVEIVNFERKNIVLAKIIIMAEVVNQRRLESKSFTTIASSRSHAVCGIKVASLCNRVEHRHCIDNPQNIQEPSWEEKI